MVNHIYPNNYSDNKDDSSYKSDETIESLQIDFAKVILVKLF